MNKWLLVLALGLLLVVGGCKNQTLVNLSGTVEFFAVSELITTLNYRDGVDQTRVILDGGADTVITSMDGRFVFRNLSRGTHTLRVSDAYYRSEEMQVVVEDDVEVTLPAQLEYWLPVYEWQTEGPVVSASGSGVLRVTHPEADALEVWVEGLLVEPLVVESNGYFQVTVPISGAEADQTYLIQLRFMQQGQMIESRTRAWVPERLTIEEVDWQEPDQLTFSWSGSCGVYTQYRLSIQSVDFTQEWNYTTTELQYTLKSTLPPGKYLWSVKAARYDVTGKFQAYVKTQAQELNIPE